MLELLFCVSPRMENDWVTYFGILSGRAEFSRRRICFSVLVVARPPTLFPIILLHFLAADDDGHNHDHHWLIDRSNSIEFDGFVWGRRREECWESFAGAKQNGWMMTGTERASKHQFSLDLIRLSEAKEEEEDENDEDEHEYDADGMWHNWRLIDILAMAMDKALAEDEEGRVRRITTFGDECLQFIQVPSILLGHHFAVITSRHWTRIAAPSWPVHATRAAARVRRTNTAAAATTSGRGGRRGWIRLLRWMMAWRCLRCILPIASVHARIGTLALSLLGWRHKPCGQIVWLSLARVVRLLLLLGGHHGGRYDGGQVLVGTVLTDLVGYEEGKEHEEEDDHGKADHVPVVHERCQWIVVDETNGHQSDQQNEYYDSWIQETKLESNLSNIIVGTSFKNSSKVPFTGLICLCPNSWPFCFTSNLETAKKTKRQKRKKKTLRITKSSKQAKGRDQMGSLQASEWGSEWVDEWNQNGTSRNDHDYPASSFSRSLRHKSNLMILLQWNKKKQNATISKFFYHSKIKIP